MKATALGQSIRVLKAGSGDWEEAPRNPEETDPPGRQTTAFESADSQFAVGLWERDLQDRKFERAVHEVAFIIEGSVEITTEDGEVLHAEAGDVLITPKGSKAEWKSLEPVRKVWAIYDE